MSDDELRAKLLDACRLGRERRSFAVAVAAARACIDGQPERRVQQYAILRVLVEEAARGGPEADYLGLVALHDALVRDGRQTTRAGAEGLLFDEDYYLQRHPDVAAAVRAGAHRDGFEHYVGHGQFEGRMPHPRGRLLRDPVPDVPAAKGRLGSAGTRWLVAGNAGVSPVAPARCEPLGVNVIGFHSANLGLGVSVRHYTRLFADAGFDVCPVEVAVPGNRSGHDTSYAERFWPLGAPAPHAVNLFVMNPHSIAELLLERYAAIRTEGRVNVALPFWELARLPRAWVPVLAGMDVLLAPSTFIRDALLADAGGVAVRDLPHPLYLPAAVHADRARWKLPADRVVFLCVFEMASDINRKNPFAGMQAFGRALGGDPRAMLVVKVNNANSEPGFGSNLRRLRELAGRHDNIRIVDDVLSYADQLALYASCDIVVSLHRAEGLGLVLMEAMTLGKPVIATAWSGNMSFTTAQNACLVDYDLVPVETATQAIYARSLVGEDACWAEARVDEAVAWMQRLVAEPDLRRRIGARAAADLADYQRRVDVDVFSATVREVAELRGIQL